MYPISIIFLSGGILGGLTNTLKELAENLYEGCLRLFIWLASFKDILNSSYGMMPEYVEVNGRWVLKPGVVSPLLRIGQTYGAALALIFLIVAMADIYMQEKMSIETFAKPFLQYIATAVLLVNCEKLVAFFWNFGILFSKDMSEVSTSELVRNFTVSFQGNKISAGMAIGLVLGAVILLVICFLMGAVIRVCAYIANFSRMIEAGIRAIGFPIAMGISVDSNLRQGAVRYMKKFLAVALQGGIFVAISLIFTATSVAVVTNQAKNLSSFKQETAEKIEADLNDMFRWDEETGELVREAGAAAGVLTPAITLDTGDGIVAIMYSVITCIIPLIGLGLGCIVVLFKSGQICNDIVGA